MFVTTPFPGQPLPHSLRDRELKPDSRSSQLSTGVLRHLIWSHHPTIGQGDEMSLEESSRSGFAVGEALRQSCGLPGPALAQGVVGGEECAAHDELDEEWRDDGFVEAISGDADNSTDGDGGRDGRSSEEPSGVVGG